jgi:hypothetical protein
VKGLAILGLGLEGFLGGGGQHNNVQTKQPTPRTERPGFTLDVLGELLGWARPTTAVFFY